MCFMMLKKILYFLSPCVVVILFCIVVMIVSWFQLEQSGGWSMLGVIIFLPVLIAAIIADLAVKLTLKKRLPYVWLTEIILLIIIYFIFVKPYV